MKLSLPPKLREKLVGVPVILFRIFFIPSYTFDALLCQNFAFSPSSNRVTSRITILLTRGFPNWRTVTRTKPWNFY
jgi:hypothetical protein